MATNSLLRAAQVSYRERRFSAKSSSRFPRQAWFGQRWW